MPTTIRRLLPPDASTFWDVRLRSVKEHPEAFLSAYEVDLARPMSEVEERLGKDDGSVVLGALDDDALVGVCGLWRQTHPKMNHKAVVWGMYVAPEARGQGIGRDLLRASVAHARTVEGVATVHLSVNVANVPARELYVSEGFVPWGVEHDAFRVEGRPQDEEHLRFDLT